MLIFIYLFIILAIGLIVFGLSPTQVKPRRLLLNSKQVANKRIRAFSILSIIFPFSQKILEKLKLKTKIKHKLDAGHSKLTPAEFFNLKLLLMLALVFFSLFLTNKFNSPIILGAIAFGYIIPDFLINRAISQRKHKIAQILPETVDLLGLCVEAGLDFTTAVRWIIEKTPLNPMLEEFAFVLEEIKWGKSRSQALKDMSKRLNIPEVSSFVQTLVQAERMGTPVAETFSLLSEDMRLQRFHQGERYAMQAPIKILIPLIFCILPVIGIVVGGPIFLQFMQGGIFKGLGK